MYKFNVFVAATLFCFSVYASAEWPNEPAGSTNKVDCPMNNPSCDGKMKAWVPGIVMQPSGALFSAPNALASHLPVNANTGGQSTTWANSQNMMDDIYVGFWWKMNADFQGYSNSANKVFFIRSFENTFGKDGTNGVFVIYGAPGAYPWHFVFGINTGGLDNKAACGLPYGEMCRENVTPFPVYRDIWYRVEAYIKSSTCHNCLDGIVRWWINDTLAGDYRNVNYGSGNMNEFHIGHTWDGQPAASCVDAVTNPKGRDCSKEWYHYFDHVYISEPNCGPAGCDIPGYVKITGTLTGARVGIAFSSALSAFGGKAPYTYSIVTGTLQDGLTMRSSGTVTGTPSCGGRRDFTVQATDANGVKGTANVSLVVSGSPVCASAIIAEEMGSQGRPIRSPVLEIHGGNVRLMLPGTGAYTLGVYDLAGKKVWNLERRPTRASVLNVMHGQIGAPIQNIKMGMELKDGVYIARLLMDGKQMVQRFTVIR